MTDQTTRPPMRASLPNWLRLALGRQQPIPRPAPARKLPRIAEIVAKAGREPAQDS